MILVTDHDVTVAHHTTGEVIGTYTINPATNYWPNNQKEPGQKAGL